jgi:AAA15 family ATPase/GTPase
MNEHFLTDIEIKQFKCFTDFKAAGFKRVNLIGGKNNIGKTALMEACYINVHAQDINKMLTSIAFVNLGRELVNIPNQEKASHELLYATIKKIKINNLEFEYIDKDTEYLFKFCIGKNEKVVNAINFMFNFDFIRKINFINIHGLPDKSLANLYESVQRNEKELYVSELVKEFDDSIESFKLLGGTKPECKKQGEWRKITEFGDGLKSYISIICALYACENGYLFIDEIDNGIYYEHLDRLWEIILTLSKQTNCQVFATTHSKEMLESFARVSEKLDEQDISYTLLLKNKKQELDTISLSYKGILESLVTHDFEVR